MAQTSDEEFIRFLVPHRSEIQAALATLYFLANLENRAGENTVERVVRGLLIGAGFSLWRAVFTASKSIDQPTNIRSSKEFLKNLIETNAVAFSAEQVSWAFGYYLNNARFRLRAIHELLPPPAQSGVSKSFEPITRPIHHLSGVDAYKTLHPFFLNCVDLLDEHLKAADFQPWPARALQDNPTYE